MKKTLLVTIDYEPAIGGVATYWRSIREALSPSDFIVLAPMVEKGTQELGVVRRSLLFKRVWPKWIKGIWQVSRVYQQTNSEQILVGQVLPVGSMVWVLHKLFGIPYIVQLYGMDLQQAKRSQRKWKLVQKILGSAKGVIVNSEAIKELVHDVLPTLPITVVYPTAIQVTQASESVKDELEKRHQLKGKKVVLTVGRLVERKGQDVTLGAMLYIWQKDPHVVYVLVGDGPDRERLERMAKSHQQQVIFAGQVSQEEKQAWLSLADVFVMPARSLSDDIEGFGIVYIEAQAAGVPVIGGDAGGVKEAIRHEQTGLLVDPEDVDELAKAILRLLNDQDLVRRLTQEANARLKDELDWREQVNKFKSALV